MSSRCSRAVMVSVCIVCTLSERDLLDSPGRRHFSHRRLRKPQPVWSKNNSTVLRVRLAADSVCHWAGVQSGNRDLRVAQYPEVNATKQAHSRIFEIFCFPQTATKRPVQNTTQHTRPFFCRLSTNTLFVQRATPRSFTTLMVSQYSVSCQTTPTASDHRLERKPSGSLTRSKTAA